MIVRCDKINQGPYLHIIGYSTELNNKYRVLVEKKVFDLFKK